MIKHKISATAILLGLLLINQSTAATTGVVPEPFQRFDATSRYTINYSQLNDVYKKLVINTGRSNREKAEPLHAATGTRMKPNVKRATVNEANRFYYEVFAGDKEAQQTLLDIQKGLEALPTEAPLEYFSRDEQLAYWLNLYNITLINEVVKVYPERKLKKLLTGKDSILTEKTLNVAGVPLSLDDIQYTILKQNYDNNPLIMYGLYQGIIGGPNIRKVAYSGANVYRNLEDNASEFINSNRGTYAKDEKVFMASSLYDRNRGYFSNFQQDLKQHLLTYLVGSEKGDLQAASTIKPDIDDWTVTDLYGSYPELGGSLASNSAALLDATSTSTNDGDGAQVSGPGYANSTRILDKSSPVSYVSPELLVYLKDVKAKRDQSNQEKATVTVEELGEAKIPFEVPAEDQVEADEEEND